MAIAWGESANQRRRPLMWRFWRRRKSPTPAERAIQQADKANERTDQFKRDRADPAMAELGRNLEENGFSRILADAYRPGRQPGPPAAGGAL